MDKLQMTNGTEAQTAFQSWAQFNARIAQLYVDASLAQIKGMQDFMAVGLTHAPRASTEAPRDLLQAEVSLIRTQMEDAVMLSRRMADDARPAAFEFADMMLHLPFPGIVNGDGGTTPEKPN